MPFTTYLYSFIEYYSFNICISQKNKNIKRQNQTEDSKQYHIVNTKIDLEKKAQKQFEQKELHKQRDQMRAHTVIISNYACITHHANQLNLI